MTRRRFRKQSVSPSLFPFLAVLVCAMGALIVLLVLVVQQARVYATSVAESRADDASAFDEELEERQLQHDDFEWQRDVFERQRAELAATLAERRLELGHLEDHIRRLEEKWTQLKAQAEQVQRLGSDKIASTEQTIAELQRLRQAIEAAGRRLVEARNEAARRRQTFAIIPYDGVNGTKRRPIYIECSEDGITIQPEGVVLRRGDLEGPLGPGNPLDAALRATREHWARQGGVATHGEPYPLLIVRPNGTLAYNYAREALKAWDDEFGYELIDAEMELEYPHRDPSLRDVLERTVQQARERQAALIAAMPSQFEQSAAVGGFVATPARGGFQPMDGAGLRTGLARAFGQSGGSRSNEPHGENSFRVDKAGSESDEVTASGNRSSGDDQTAQQAAGQGRGAAAPAGPGGPLTSGVAQGPGGISSSLAKRGANWGVPKATAGATAYRIPVRVVCQDDRLAILPRPSENTPPAEILAPDPLAGAIDDFVTLLWKQIEQWDAAPVGGYWQPVLEVYVHPGAEGRFVELRSLLSGSGIQVQRQVQ